jgi:hypothetical protein
MKPHLSQSPNESAQDHTLTHTISTVQQQCTYQMMHYRLCLLLSCSQHILDDRCYRAADVAQLHRHTCQGIAAVAAVR